MIEISSDRVHAALISHVSGTSSTPDHHDALQASPRLHNFKLNNGREQSEPDPASLLLDGRLLPAHVREPQERAVQIIPPPAKQRVKPPLSLTLAIPEQSLARDEWHIVSSSPGASDSGAATHNQLDYSEIGTGYFSPAQSPDASPTTPVPPIQPPPTTSLKRARLRARSVTNGDLSILSVGKNRGAHKMVKERRSLQSFFSTPFLQPHSTPLGVVPGPRTEVHSMPAQGNASSTNAGSSAPSGADESRRSERGRSFYSRRRSHTYSGSGRDNALTSPSLAAFPTRVPPMPEVSEVYPPLSIEATAAGRESPSSYLLDEDPFAVSSPTLVAPSLNSATRSPGYTPIISPACSITHSRTSSSVSFSSASSTSMPSTPGFQSFFPLLEEEENEGLPATSASAAPLQSVPVPPPPPPTPTSPLNPNLPSGSALNEGANSKERMLRPVFALTPVPALDHSHSASASPRPRSPTHASSSIQSLQQPPPTRARPAHTRPAFAPRPSLPSLSTLSRMGVAAGEFASSLRGKKRHGKVGAGLPEEPWDLPSPKPASEEQMTEKQEKHLKKKASEKDCGEATSELFVASSESMEPCLSKQCDAENSPTNLDEHPVVRIDAEQAQGSSCTVDAVDHLDIPTPQDLEKVQTIDGKTESPGTSHLNPELEKQEQKDNENVRERAAGRKDGKRKIDVDVGNAHGEGALSTDREVPYIMSSFTSSENVEDANGGSADAAAKVEACSDNVPYSDTSKEREDMPSERDTDREADQLVEVRKLLNVELPGDDSKGSEDIERLAAPEPEPRSPVVNGRPRAVTLPGHTSAISKHILRSLTPYPFVVPRSASPVPTDASWSPESSLEDFGVLLSSPPAFCGDQRPESLTIDPALPSTCAHTEALEYEEPFSSRNDHLNFADGASSLSLTFAPLPRLLPLSIRREGADPEIEGSAEATRTDIDLRSANDGAFASEAALPAESLTTRNCATLSDASLPFEEPLSPSSPVATFSEPESLERSLSRSPIREGEYSFAFASPEDRSLSPQHEEACLNDHDHKQLGHELEGEHDSSMLPPLSTLPEEDPVFTLTPGHSRERSGRCGYESLSSRSLSRKASAATLASIFSMRSGSSGRVSHSSHLYSRTQSPAASLSTTLPISTSQTGPEAGSSQARRAHGSRFSSADAGRGHAASSSASSLRSKSFVDLRGLAKSRRNGSESSGVSLLTHSSPRTKIDPQLQAHARKESSVEDVALGLRAYAGNAYAAAVQAELEGKASKYELPSSTRFGDDELVIDIKPEDKKPSEPAVSGWKPYDSKVAGIDTFEPGSSAGTLRPSSTQQTETERTDSRSPSESNKPSETMESLTSALACTHANGYEYSGGRSGGKDWGDARGYGSGYYGQRKGSSGDNYAGNYRGSNMGQGGRDNSRDDDRDGSSRRPSTYSSSESESESESETDSDVYVERSPRSQSSKAHTLPIHALPPPAAAHEDSHTRIFTQLRKGRKGVFKPAAGSVAEKGVGGHAPAAEDDDVPIAQRIPGAVQAQKSIRQKVKSEHERRRHENSVASSQRTSRAPEGTISPPPQHVPGVNQDERGRTLMARVPRTAPLGIGVAALSSSQGAAMTAQRTAQPQYAARAVHRPRAKTLGGADGPGVPAEALAKRLLNVQMRDQDAQMPEQRTSAVASTHTPLSATDKSPVERSLAERTTRRRAPSPQHVALQLQQPSADAPVPPLTLRPMRSLHGVSREPVSPTSIPVPPIPALSVRQRSPSRARQSHDVNVPSDGLSRSKSVKSPRRSEEDAHILAAHYPRPMAGAVPPLPAVSRGPSPPAPSSRHNLNQMRIYIGDMQRFNVVEVGLDTSAKDVLDMLRQQGDLRGEERRSASWVLYEVCHDFGMERPVRSFELVADISGSWDKEKTKNCFMVKPSSFAQILTNVPSSIPTRSGFVDYESKKGKWNKRWLELREHGLWISKREGKDDEFLCSLSVFDAYIVTRIHKATKTFSFAVKSTDPITLFENKADYLHVFSVPEDTGIAWLETIWLARSYILYQEKNVLFRNKAEGGANVARSGTRKKPAQTYITLSQPKMPGTAEATGPFEPGSLLAKRAVS